MLVLWGEFRSCGTGDLLSVLLLADHPTGKFGVQRRKVAMLNGAGEFC